jgi:hypothetical protein
MRTTELDMKLRWYDQSIDELILQSVFATCLCIVCWSKAKIKGNNEMKIWQSFQNCAQILVLFFVIASDSCMKLN